MKLGTGMTAVVTGGASGLWEAVVRRLVAEGAKVAIFDMNGERGEALAGELGAVLCKVDVSSDASVAAGFARVRETNGQERIRVNCAGIVTGVKTAARDRKSGEIKTFPMADFERVVQINLLGTFRCMAQSAAGMLTTDPPGRRGTRGDHQHCQLGGPGRPDWPGRVWLPPGPGCWA